MGRAGNIVTQSSGYKAFIPNRLPPEPPLNFDIDMVRLLSEANLSLGKLAGLTSIISDPDLFCYLYVRKEALLSSQIEGTQCSLEDVLVPEASEGESDEHLKEIEEVSNYVRAMNQGLELLEKLPVCTRLIKEMHSVLMNGVRGQNKTPGEFRVSQNWIGRPGATLANADFVPPPHEMVGSLMGDLENFIHAEDQIPPLIKAALVHAQFETIHPFLDGNGRLGRLLITYLLCYWKVLDKPLLYLSYYFKAYRSEYYSRLMNIRYKGEWEEWIKFFLNAVKESARMANKTAIEIYNVQQRDLHKLQSERPTAFTSIIFQEFCRNPILTTNRIVQLHPDATQPKMQRTLAHLQSLGIIREVSGKQRHKKYIYWEYLAVLTHDTVIDIG